MELFFYILETVGVISFSVAGAVAAIDREIDLFGVLFLSLVTSFGGGMLRDVCVCRGIGGWRRLDGYLGGHSRP